MLYTHILLYKWYLDPAIYSIGFMVHACPHTIEKLEKAKIQVHSTLSLLCLFFKVTFFCCHFHRKWSITNEEIALYGEREREREIKLVTCGTDILFRSHVPHLNGMREAAMSELPYPNEGRSCSSKSNWLCHPKVPGTVNLTHICCHIEGWHTLKQKKYRKQS